MCQVRQTVGGILPEIPVNAGRQVPVPRGESGVIEIAVCDTNGFPFIVFERPVYARDNRTAIPCLEILVEERLSLLPQRNHLSKVQEPLKFQIRYALSLLAFAFAASMK